MTIDLQTIQTTAVWVLVGIAVLGLIAAIVIKKVVGKIIALVLAAVLIAIGWQQRQHAIAVANDLRGSACAASVTFFAIDVGLPDDWCTTG